MVNDMSNFARSRTTRPRKIKGANFSYPRRPINRSGSQRTSGYDLQRRRNKIVHNMVNTAAGITSGKLIETSIV